MSANRRKTQRQIAVEARVSPSYINDLLHGRANGPSWVTAKKLAKVLGCEPTEIMEDAPGCIRKALEVDNS